MTHKVVMPSVSSGIYRTSDRKRYGGGLREIFEKKEEVKGKGMGSILLGGVGAASSYESVDDYRKTMGAGLKSKVMSLKPKRHNIHFDM
jgi:hypothetical protein